MAKNMRVLRDLPKFSELIEEKRARLREYSGRKKTVYLQWDLNQEAINEQVFKLVIQDDAKHEPVEILLDKQELIHYLRAV